MLRLLPKPLAGKPHSELAPQLPRRTDKRTRIRSGLHAVCVPEEEIRHPSSEAPRHAYLGVERPHRLYWSQWPAITRSLNAPTMHPVRGKRRIRNRDGSRRRQCAISEEKVVGYRQWLELEAPLTDKPTPPKLVPRPTARKPKHIRLPPSLPPAATPSQHGARH